MIILEEHGTDPQRPFSREQIMRMMNACSPKSEGFDGLGDRLSRRQLRALCQAYLEKIDRVEAPSPYSRNGGQK